MVQFKSGTTSNGWFLKLEELVSHETNYKTRFANGSVPEKHKLVVAGLMGH